MEDFDSHSIRLHILFTCVHHSSAPANPECQEGVRSCISMYSGSGGRIQLKVLPDYQSHSTIENRTCWAMLFLRKLDTNIDKWIEPFLRKIIQCHCKQACRK